MLVVSKKYTWLWLIALLLVPIVLWALPGDFFDDSKVILCPSRLFFGIECFGCGMTRAVMHLHHAQFDDATFFNQSSFVIYPLLIALWISWVIKAARQLQVLKV